MSGQSGLMQTPVEAFYSARSLRDYVTSQESSTEKVALAANATSRRLSIALRLSSGQAVRVDDIAHEFSCSRRTIFRDLQHIRQQPSLKVALDPITFELVGASAALDRRNGCLPTKEQRMAAAVALAVTRMHPYGISPAHAKLAIESLRGSLEADSRGELDRLLAVIDPIRSKANRSPTLADKLAADLVSLARQGEAVEITHRASNRTVQTQIVPRCIDRTQQGLTLKGFSVLAEREVVIAFDNIVDVSPVDNEAGCEITPENEHAS